MEILGFSVINSLDYQALQEQITQLQIANEEIQKVNSDKQLEVDRLSRQFSNLKHQMNTMSSEAEDIFCKENIELLTSLDIDWTVPTNKGKIARTVNKPSILNNAKTAVISKARTNNDLSLTQMTKDDIIKLIHKNKLVEATIAIGYLAKSKLENQ
jgi:hypothetical protein